MTDRVQYSAYGMITLRGGTNDTPFLYNGRYGVMTDSNGLFYMRARRILGKVRFHFSQKQMP